MQKARLSTCPVSRFVDSAVLPHFEWAPPRWLDVLLPATGLDTRDAVTADNPARMLFVVANDTSLLLPTEAGCGHWRALPDGARVLAPWAIDDATDAFFEARTAPEEVLTLATDSLRGVFWGLHDWAHFHSHGPFERVAETELQCDVAALVWLGDNRLVLDLDLDALARVTRDVLALWQVRYAAEARVLEAQAALAYLAQRTGVAQFALPPDAHA